MLNFTISLLTLSNNIILCFSSDIWTFSLKEREENAQVKNELILVIVLVRHCCQYYYSEVTQRKRCWVPTLLSSNTKHQFITAASSARVAELVWKPEDSASFLPSNFHPLYQGISLGCLIADVYMNSRKVSCSFFIGRQFRRHAHNMQPPSSLTLTTVLLPFDLHNTDGVYFFISLWGQVSHLSCVLRSCDDWDTTIEQIHTKRILKDEPSSCSCVLHNTQEHTLTKWEDALCVSTTTPHTYCTAIMLVSIAESSLPSAVMSETSLSVSVGRSAAQAPQASEAAAE